MKILPILTMTISLPFLTAYADEQGASNPGAQLPGAGNTTVTDQNTEAAAPVDSSPDATLKLHGGSVAAGIGYVWGHGTLSYQGNEHKFSISGVS
ncbi:MAG TPA: hypothetical protein VK437_10620, partial [Steroidobacteraceae bacterium]|nr:hypothetical protein [Steroidobacteraceae bacterium]